MCSENQVKAGADHLEIAYLQLPRYLGAGRAERARSIGQSFAKLWRRARAIAERQSSGGYAYRTAAVADQHHISISLRSQRLDQNHSPSLTDTSKLPHSCWPAGCFLRSAQEDLNFICSLHFFNFNLDTFCVRDPYCAVPWYSESC